MYLLLRYGIVKVPVNSLESAEFTGAGKYPILNNNSIITHMDCFKTVSALQVHIHIATEQGA